MNSNVLLVHHAANRGYVYPPNSIRGLQACLNAGARVVEIDVSPLADGNFLLLHDGMLESGTTGSGLVGSHTADQISSLRLTCQGAATDDQPALAQALAQYPRGDAVVEY